MRFVDLGGLTLHYALTGAAAEKPVVVFINSLGTDFRIWDGIVARLAGDCTLLAYDLRGHGLSDLGTTPYRIETHAADLEALLDRLGLGRVVLCGLSVGGLIAQGFYARNPLRVERLVLSNTAHRIGTAGMWNARISDVREKGLESMVAAVMERWFTPAFRRPENAAFRLYCNMLARQPREGYAATCAAIRDADYTEAARRIAVPTLCIGGDGDGSTPPALVRELAALIPGARFELIAGAGHIPCVEQPEAYAALLRSFLDGAPFKGVS